MSSFEWSVVSVTSGWRTPDGGTPADGGTPDGGTPDGGTGLHTSQEPPLFFRTVWWRLQFITVLQYIFPACKWTFLERSIKVSWRAGGRSLDPSGPSHCYLVFLTFCGRGLSTIWLFAERSLKVLSTETLNEPSGNVPQRFSVGFCATFRSKPVFVPSHSPDGFSNFIDKQFIDWCDETRGGAAGPGWNRSDPPT